jgi:dihydropteroate synthase
MNLRLGRYAFRFPRPALVMGVVNVTPDSFSDGGLHFTTDAAVTHALELARQGADILDIGGESTRPGAAPVSELEECRRVLPVIEQLAGLVQIPLSIDTLKPGVARAAVAAGASLINDVGANRPDPAPMHALLADCQTGYVCMHMQGTPQTMQLLPTYDSVVDELLRFFERQLSELSRAGVDLDTVILDVGFGFGKTLEHNLQLLAAWDRFTRLGRPLLLGVSRKSFIGKLLDVDVNHRLPGSLACACWGVLNGAQLIRTHDVAETLQAVRTCEAIAQQRASWSGNS